MERARKLWERLELPKLEPEAPWHGYSLGDWNPELDLEAQLAVAGKFWGNRRKDRARAQKRR
jgi:4-hydroxy-3-polyprenylbenzoate decarboxylase